MKINEIQLEINENLLKIIEMSMKMQWYDLMKINGNHSHSIEKVRKSIENH